MRALFGPWTDAIVLGGGSLVALALLEVIPLSNENLVFIGAAMLFLANFVNHPHFALSYQLFYGLRNSLNDSSLEERAFKRRWIWAAFVAPVLIVAVLSASAFRWKQGDGLWIALCINLMGALVGWHYVKQGFGMVMLDAGIKRSYWSLKTRTALLWNAYACWITAWLIINSFNGLGPAFWGFFSLPVPIPLAVALIGCAIVLLTTAWVGLAVFRDLSDRRRAGAQWSELPLNGILAYVVTLYVWTMFSWVNTAFLLVIPFFHSLQYLAVVYRHALNGERLASEKKAMRLLKIFLPALGLGLAGFWALPGAVDFIVTGKVPLFSKGVFVSVALAWIFINVHHYLIDNVLWRKESVRVNAQLFAHLENQRTTQRQIDCSPEHTTSISGRAAGFTLIELMIVVAIIGILAAIAVPQYQTYVLRAQVQRVVAEAAALKPSIDLCLHEGRVNVGVLTTEGNCDPQGSGSNLQATGGNSAPTTGATWSSAGSGVPYVSLSGTTASTIVATFGNLAGSALQSGPGTITWTRSLDGTWACRTANLDAKYAASTCPL